MKWSKRKGWGRERFGFTFSDDFENFSELTKGDNGLPVGLGRSYGDSSINSNGVSWSVKSEKFIEIDLVNKLVHVGAGVTIGELERAASKVGLFPPVVPGTEFVSIGGAIAANIHGKSHNKFGSFVNHLVELTLINHEGQTLILHPDGESQKLFKATVGGIGLTGIIQSARIRLIDIETSFFVVEDRRANNLLEVIEFIYHFDSIYDYTVAWIDFSGEFQGRGIVSGGNHATLDQLSKKQRNNPLKIALPRNLSVPDIFPSFFINKNTIRVFNAIWFHKPIATEIVSYMKFLHPLDSLRNWNRVYGKRGFLQYQFVVPFEHVEFLFAVLKEFRKIGAASFLTVLKKFESDDDPYLSFPIPGWTLAVDIKVGIQGLEKLLQRLDEQIILLGGRVYLVKDSRISELHFKKMYPMYTEFLKVKTLNDPNNYWQSDQGRRLGLC